MSMSADAGATSTSTTSVEVTCRRGDGGRGIDGVPCRQCDHQGPRAGLPRQVEHGLEGRHAALHDRGSDPLALVVCNFTSVRRPDLRLGAPDGIARWREALNTDPQYDGGSNLGNGEREIVAEPAGMRLPVGRWRVALDSSGELTLGSEPALDGVPAMPERARVVLRDVLPDKPASPTT